MSVASTKNLSTLFSNLVKRKNNGNNLLDTCFSLPNRGIGRKICKKGWTEDETYWTVTKTKFGKTTCTNSSLRGQAYGILTWAGKTDSKERQITDVYSKTWSIYPTLKFSKADPIELEDDLISEQVETAATESTEESQTVQN